VFNPSLPPDIWITTKIRSSPLASPATARIHRLGTPAPTATTPPTADAFKKSRRSIRAIIATPFSPTAFSSNQKSPRHAT
jgi:hypothetical protein